MRKTILAALMFSVFGTGAIAGDCDCVWDSWFDCRECEMHIHNYERMGTEGWFGVCVPCSHAYCEDLKYKREGTSPSLERQKAREVLQKLEPKMLQLRGNNILKMALEIADENPRVAGTFFGMYTLANKKGVSIPQEAVVWGHGDPVASPLTVEKAKEFIREYHNHGKYNKEKYADDTSAVKYEYNYRLKEAADGSAYIVIKISSVDKEKKEIEKITPNIRIDLRNAKDEEGEYWEPIGWSVVD